MTDLLMLNASNVPEFPIYPYAFVQVRALARRRGLTVAGYDLLGHGPDERDRALARLVERHRPRMLGVHLRQADTVFVNDYVSEPRGYFPVEETRELVESLRRLSSAPVVAGGFGFTTHADVLFDELGVDLAVQGEPDTFLDRFDAVLESRDLETVPNLLYRRAGKLCINAREYFGPLDDREYDDAVVDELERFYSRGTLYGPNPPTVAVELARGCPYRCYFCTEPAVKGRRVRERDLDVVFGEIDFLYSRGVRRVWLVCSELNMGTAALAMRVAERMIRFNEGRASDPMSWRAYHLPRWLGRGELELLYRSGFLGGWNDFPSFDDENLAESKVPYRAEHALTHLRLTEELRPPRAERKFSIFLGNASMTPAALRTTLLRYADGGFPVRMDTAVVGGATRVFRPSGETPAGDSPAGAFTVRRSGRAPGPVLAHPTYFWPGRLRALVADEGDLIDFFRYAETTLLSRAYLSTRDWCAFLRGSDGAWLIDALDALGPTAPSLSEACEALAPSVQLALREIARNPARLLAFVDPPPEQRAAANAVCLVQCKRLSRRPTDGFAAALRDLECTAETSNVRLLLALIDRGFVETEAALAALCERAGSASDPLARWQLSHFFYARNIVLRPAYAALLSGVKEVCDDREREHPRDRDPRDVADAHCVR